MIHITYCWNCGRPVPVKSYPALEEKISQSGGWQPFSSRNVYCCLCSSWVGIERSYEPVIGC